MTSISDEAVEAACAAFYNDPSGLTSWDRLTLSSPDIAGRYRAGMRRSLEAAAPYMLADAQSEVWDKGVDWAWEGGQTCTMKTRIGDANDQ